MASLSALSQILRDLPPTNTKAGRTVARQDNEARGWGPAYPRASQAPQISSPCPGKHQPIPLSLSTHVNQTGVHDPGASARLG